MYSSLQGQPAGGESPPIPASAKQPKNEKRPPSGTPPASASPVAPIAKALATPVKNGEPKEAKAEPPRYPAFTPYPAPPPLPAG